MRCALCACCVPAAYRKLVLKHHPDKANNKKQAEAKFIEIQVGCFLSCCGLCRMRSAECAGRSRLQAACLVKEAAVLPSLPCSEPTRSCQTRTAGGAMMLGALTSTARTITSSSRCARACMQTHAAELRTRMRTAGSHPRGAGHCHFNLIGLWSHRP